MTAGEPTFNFMFNVHNSKSLAGYGYFPPIAFQALANRCNPDINPIDGTRLIMTPEKKMMKFMMGLSITFLVLLVLIL